MLEQLASCSPFVEPAPGQTAGLGESCVISRQARRNYGLLVIDAIWIKQPAVLTNLNADVRPIYAPQQMIWGSRVECGPIGREKALRV